MKITTIDFDIIMNPCIDIYNDADLTADQYLTKFDFLGYMKADLKLYKKLTNFIVSFKSDQVTFIYSHADIIEELNKIKFVNCTYNSKSAAI